MKAGKNISSGLEHKVVHLFTSESLYTYSYFRFLERNYDISKSLFVFKNKTGKVFDHSPAIREKILKCKNNLDFISNIVPLLKKSDRVLLHQLPCGPSLVTWNFLPGILLKSSWIIWGGDLYFYKNSRENLKNIFYEKLRKRILAKIPRYVTLIPGEFELASKRYNKAAIHFPAIYPPPLDFTTYKGSRWTGDKSADIVILAGNSGNPSNNHHEILSKLVSVRDMKIKIICPLSYSGNNAYINSIVAAGDSIFGNKFIPLLEFITPENYLDLLWNADIAIMNHDRQQGIGNILPLLYFGKKVFIRSDTTTYRYLSEIGCRLYDLLPVKSFNNQELSLDHDELDANHKIIGELISEENCIHMWDRILK